MNRILFFLFICLFLHTGVSAQITAQGQGGKFVFWNAVGFDQQIGRFTLHSVLGYSRNSGLNSYNPFRQPGIFTVRQEADYRISKKFSTSLGLMYSERFYEDDTHPDYINEIRLYPRITHHFRAGRLRFSQYLRTDFRWFFRPHFYDWHKPMEIRTRYRMKMNVPLDKKERNSLVVMTELLAATDEEKEADGRKVFGKFLFTENRTSVYYRHHIPKPDMYLDFGIMNQTWRDGQSNVFRYTFILQTDVIFVNLFGKKK